MKKEHPISQLVYAAKTDIQKADDLIRSYIPFLRSEASKHTNKICTEQDDEFSIAMIAFHEAIKSYDRERGAFLPYASLLIRSRIIDHQRKEQQHKKNISLHTPTDDPEKTILDSLKDDKDPIEESLTLEATKQEIAELAEVLRSFGLNFSDVAEHSPKQERTLAACTAAIRFAVQNKELLQDLLATKKLPMAQLVQGSGADRKTLERHRKYILAMLLVQTNGYEIIRGHIAHVLQPKGGMSK